MVELEGRTICNLVGRFGMRNCRKEYITAFLICDFLFSYSLPHLFVFSLYTCNLHWFIFIPVLFTFVLDFSEQFDGGSFAKLFVGSVPRTATEEDVSQSIHIPKKKKKWLLCYICPVILLLFYVVDVMLILMSDSPSV